MDPYEYLTIFISVVLGLAVVHLLSGVSLILDTRVRGHGVPPSLGNLKDDSTHLGARV